MGVLRRRREAVEKKVSRTAEEVIERSKEEFEPRGDVRAEDLVSTGSALLNLACSGFNPYGGYYLGSFVHIVGDSNVGKSLLCLNMMAEAVKDKKLGGYDLVYEEPEAAMHFPLERMFGSGISRVRFIPPEEERIEPRTVQNWHNDLVSANHPFIWVTDSFDALTSLDALKDKKDARGNKREIEKGGYDTEKPTVASRTFPKLVGPIKANHSIFVMVSQTRDDIGSMFGGKGFSGGNAIKFYRAHEIWLARLSSITKEVRGKKREIGQLVGVKVKKNKLTGKVRTVKFPIYYDYGIDDVGSMIDWMVEENFWGKTKQTIQTEEGFIDATQQKLIEHVEENNLEDKLRQVVAECWAELEGEIKIPRKPRY